MHEEKRRFEEEQIIDFVKKTRGTEVDLVKSTILNENKRLFVNQFLKNQELFTRGVHRKMLEKLLRFKNLS